MGILVRAHLNYFGDPEYPVVAVTMFFAHLSLADHAKSLLFMLPECNELVHSSLMIQTTKCCSFQVTLI